MFKHILIPTDGSRLSEKAARAGVELAKAIGAKVTTLFAAPAPTPLVYEDYVPVDYMPPDEHQAMIERAAARYLGVVEAAAKAAGVRCQALTITSEYPAETILEVAAKQRCDLIFMASHGRHGLKALLLGSETQKVLAHAKTPVFVFRSR